MTDLKTPVVAAKTSPPTSATAAAAAAVPSSTAPGLGPFDPPAWVRTLAFKNDVRPATAYYRPYNRAVLAHGPNIFHVSLNVMHAILNDTLEPQFSKDGCPSPAERHLANKQWVSHLDGTRLLSIFL